MESHFLIKVSRTQICSFLRCADAKPLNWFLCFVWTKVLSELDIVVPLQLLIGMFSDGVNSLKELANQRKARASDLSGNNGARRVSRMADLLTLMKKYQFNWQTNPFITWKNVFITSEIIYQLNKYFFLSILRNYLLEINFYILSKT